LREHKQHNGVNEMIEHRLIPDCRSAVPNQHFFEPVRTKGAQANR
jgi:hypothetical protein